MEITKKNAVMKKMKNFATMAGKLNALSSATAQKKQDEIEQQNLLNIEIEKGIAQEKFFNAVLRKVKTDADAKLILQNIQEYESIIKLFGKDTEPSAKLMLCKGMQLETYQKGQPIIKQGEPSNNKFYVIAQGSVVIVKATDTNVFQVSQQQDEEKKEAQGKQKKEKEQPPDVLAVEIQKYGKEINTLKQGQGFGEAAIIETDPRKAKRGATILAREDQTQLIIIMKREFQKFKDTFSSQGKEKAQILTSLIPQLKLINSTQTRDDLIFYFQEEGGLRGQQLTVEGKIGDKLYVLKEGQLEIKKNYVNQKNIYYHDIQKLKISSLSNPSFFGEEILYDNEDKPYNYTITISSIQARFYTIKKSIIMFKFPNLRQDILNEYELKEEHRKKTVNYILSKNQQPSNMIEVGETLHEYNKLKNFDLFSQMKSSMVDVHNKNVFKGVQKNDKFQNQDDIVKLRLEMIKEFEEKQNQGQKTNSQTLIPSEEQVNQQLQLQLKERPFTGISRKQKAFASQQQVQIPNIDQDEEQEDEFKQFKQNFGSNSSISTNKPIVVQRNNFTDPNENKQIINNLNLNPNSNSNTNTNKPLPVPLDPVYSRVYQQQHDFEQNFMENLLEKLKLMNKAQQGPKESPQLDLGYLEQFKKKQQHKLRVMQKNQTNNQYLINNRNSVLQKKIDQIKNKYLKESAESDIIVQDGIAISNSNPNTLFNTLFSKSQQENTPKSNKHNITNDSLGTPQSAQGNQFTRNSVQGIQPINVVKFSSFKSEGTQTKKNASSQPKGSIFKVGVFQQQQQQLTQNQSSPQLKNYFIAPTIQSVPSLFVLNSQREHIQSNFSNASIQTPQNGKNIGSSINNGNNLNQKSESKVGNFSSYVQSQKVFSQSTIITNFQQNKSEQEEINDDKILSQRYSNYSALQFQSPFRNKNQKKDNINSSFEEDQTHQNYYSSSVEPQGLFISADFNGDKFSKAIQLQQATPITNKKDKLHPQKGLSPLEKNTRQSFEQNQRSVSSQQLKRISLQRQKLKTGLSLIKKPLATQPF
ncbi:cyclic nucleotide-binding domain protein (macronuclear) [Tetrahymena thermophila SB210]|uniref:Cyclic nucleotide-binding domain protein n=1 Tax=Tetrahymena thermophila (strain SB210) TaxID=312017 RepID=I7MMS9_TETTS|nr:cyclic nucleotide-binding domain protein [Tetrahymena thermophila SB210]EAS06336.1 cyclic nucleotide-binding domain protein [Tetrahymena thermophila SB210]|eukprot:XP_001026581.1 cyclic nucleotide-binding domain protein [Tetrahymena thermophila SB210]